MKEFWAAADIEVQLLFDSAKLTSSSSEDLSVQGADRRIVGKGSPEADLRVREIHLGNSAMLGALVLSLLSQTISDLTNSRN